VKWKASVQQQLDTQPSIQLLSEEVKSLQANAEALGKLQQDFKEHDNEISKFKSTMQETLEAHNARMTALKDNQKTYADMVKNNKEEDGDGWQVQGSSKRKLAAPQLPKVPIQAIRFEVDPTVVSISEKDLIAEKGKELVTMTAGSTAANSIHDVWPQKFKRNDKDAGAIVVFVSSIHAAEVFKNKSKLSNGWRVVKHLNKDQLSARRELWKKFNSELTAAREEQHTLRYAENYRSVSWGQGQSNNLDA
jgi:hypothetical protein